MSTLPTYASPTAPFVPAVAAPVHRAGTDRESRKMDRAAKTLAGHLRPGRAIEVKIATRPKELYSAFELVYEAYLRSGLAKPNPYRMRVTPYHLLPTTEVFVAMDRGEVIGTMSLVGDGELGLPMETLYAEQVAWGRMQGISLAEVSCLADQRQGLKESFPVVMRLMSLMAQCAERRGIDELMIAVHPRHARFYQRFTAFEPIGEEKTYQTVCDNPAVAMALDLKRAPIDYPRLYKRFFGARYPDEALSYRPIPDQVLSELRLVVDETYDPETGSAFELLACA